MSSQEMQVRWRHHQLGLLSYLRQMLASELFVDVTLCCQGRRLRAHRVLLSASSPYLQALLLSHPTNEHTTIILHDVSYEDMRSLLDFIYTGGVNLPESRLPSFLSAAEALNITVLTDKHLHQTIPSSDEWSLTYKTMPPLIKVDHDHRPGFARWNEVKYDLLRHNEDTKYHPDYLHQTIISRTMTMMDDTKPSFLDGKLLGGVESSRCSSFSDSSEDSQRRSIDSGLEVLNSPSYDKEVVKTKQEDLRCCYQDKEDVVRMSRSPEYHHWARPLPSLMPIAPGSATPYRRSPRHSLGGILTPSPWAQNGRPPVGAPRRPPTDEVKSQEPPNVFADAKLPEEPSRLKCPPNHQTSGEFPADKTAQLLHPVENDENRPFKSDVIKLCKLKERRLQDFYREQRLNGQQMDGSERLQVYQPPSNEALSLTTTSRHPAESQTGYATGQDKLAVKSSSFLSNINEFSNSGVNSSSSVLPLNRILKVEQDTGSQMYEGDVTSPLNGLKSITNILEEQSQEMSKANLTCLLQRQPPPPTSSTLDPPQPPLNDTNNNTSSKHVDDLGKHCCAECGLHFQIKQELADHLKGHTTSIATTLGPPFTCPVCAKTFAQRGHFTTHQKLHQDAKLPEHSCSHCGKAFLTRASLKVHLRTHTGEKPFHCGECGKQFSQLRNYKYHRSVHEGTKEFAATCPECGKYFNDRGYLSSHMKIHRNRKEYGCEYCGKSFNQRVAYNMHVRIHTGVKPHVCPHCSKSFSRKMLLKQHLRIHTGEKPFTCVVCQKAFADRSNMTLHMRLHSGVKPYTCGVCAKAFTKKHHLKTHMNYHTGVKPYACSKCGLRFSQSSNMRTHYKKCTSPPLAAPPTGDVFPGPPTPSQINSSSSSSSSMQMPSTTTTICSPHNSPRSSLTSPGVASIDHHPK